MSTTPAEEFAYSARAFRPDAVVEPPDAATGSTTFVGFVELSSAPVANSRPVTVPAPSSAATSATATTAPAMDRRPRGPSGGVGGSASRPFLGPVGGGSMMGADIKTSLRRGRRSGIEDEPVALGRSLANISAPYELLRASTQRGRLAAAVVEGAAGPSLASSAMSEPLTLDGIELTRIGLGTNRLTDTPGNRELLTAAVDAGLNFIDTANGYTNGESERTIGGALSPFRENVVVATKGGYRDGRPDAIGAQIEASLQQLGTDTIPLYYLHRVDPDVPLETSLG